MGWYRQLGRQLGLADNFLSRSVSVLLLAGPCLLMPRLLASTGAHPLLLLPILAWLAGRLSLLFGLPATPAMLLVGLGFRAVGAFTVIGHWRSFVYQTRYVAVAVVLLKGGLALCHLPNLLLILVPCVLEASCVALLARYLLAFPWHWGYIFGTWLRVAAETLDHNSDASQLHEELDIPTIKDHLRLLTQTYFDSLAATPAAQNMDVGATTLHWRLLPRFAMSASSASVTADKVTQLRAAGYGKRELYNLILPTSTVENIFSITAFTVTLTMALIREGDWWTYTLKGPVAILLGLIWAVSWAFISALFPLLKDENLVAKRSAMMLLGSLVVYIGAKEFGVPPGGPLGTVAMGATTSFFWASQGWTEGKNPVLGVVSVVWDLLEAALFGYVGAEVDVWRTSSEDILICSLIMIVSMAVRLCMFYITVVLIRRELSPGEVLFGTLVWLPKATVLAALCPQVLDNVRKSLGHPSEETTEEFRMARLVLLGSVIEMIVTAPIGYILTRCLGERLLPKKKETDKEAGVVLTNCSSGV